MPARIFRASAFIAPPLSRASRRAGFSADLDLRRDEGQTALEWTLASPRAATGPAVTRRSRCHALHGRGTATADRIAVRLRSRRGVQADPVSIGPTPGSGDERPRRAVRGDPQRGVRAIANDRGEVAASGIAAVTVSYRHWSAAGHSVGHGRRPVARSGGDGHRRRGRLRRPVEQIRTGSSSGLGVKREIGQHRRGSGRRGEAKDDYDNCHGAR